MIPRTICEWFSLAFSVTFIIFPTQFLRLLISSFCPSHYIAPKHFLYGSPGTEFLLSRNRLSKRCVYLIVTFYPENFISYLVSVQFFSLSILTKMNSSILSQVSVLSIYFLLTVSLFSCTHTTAQQFCDLSCKYCCWENSHETSLSSLLWLQISTCTSQLFQLYL